MPKRSEKSVIQPIEANRTIIGNVLDVLKTFPDNCIDQCITSPPYFGLRSYGTEPQIWDNDPNCDHLWGNLIPHEKSDKRSPETKAAQGSTVGSNLKTSIHSPEDHGKFCQRCGAWLGELGREPRVTDYIRHMIQIFAEVYRVLKPTGTCFVNLGDSHNSGGNKRTPSEVSTINKNSFDRGTRTHADKCLDKAHDRSDGLTTVRPSLQPVKRKSLLNVPSRFRIAMTDSECELRSDLTEEQKLYVVSELVKRGII